MEQMPDLEEKFTSELGSGFQPAVDDFFGFFHAIDWKEPWIIGLMLFHFTLLLMTIASRKNTNFQMSLFLLAWAGVYLGERINKLLGKNWESFAGQNYFDSHGLFFTVLWCGPLLIIIIAILINTFINLCELVIRWKKAERRERARLARDKRD